MREPCYTRLKTALELRQMKQSELSKLTGIGKSAISQYISGKFIPKQKALHIIAKTLDVSESWLMGYDVPINNNNDFLELFNLLDENEKKEIIEHIVTLCNRKK